MEVLAEKSPLVTVELLALVAAVSVMRSMAGIFNFFFKSYS